MSDNSYKEFYSHIHPSDELIKLTREKMIAEAEKKKHFAFVLPPKLKKFTPRYAVAALGVVITVSVIFIMPNMDGRLPSDPDVTVTYTPPVSGSNSTPQSSENPSGTMVPSGEGSLGSYVESTLIVSGSDGETVITVSAPSGSSAEGNSSIHTNNIGSNSSVAEYGPANTFDPTVNESIPTAHTSKTVTTAPNSEITTVRTTAETDSEYTTRRTSTTTRVTTTTRRTTATTRVTTTTRRTNVTTAPAPTHTRVSTTTPSTNTSNFISGGPVTSMTSLAPPGPNTSNTVSGNIYDTNYFGDVCINADVVHAHNFTDYADMPVPYLLKSMSYQDLTNYFRRDFLPTYIPYGFEDTSKGYRNVAFYQNSTQDCGVLFEYGNDSGISYVNEPYMHITASKYSMPIAGHSFAFSNYRASSVNGVNVNIGVYNAVNESISANNVFYAQFYYNNIGYSIYAKGMNLIEFSDVLSSMIY